MKLVLRKQLVWVACYLLISCSSTTNAPTISKFDQTDKPRLYLNFALINILNDEQAQVTYLDAEYMAFEDSYFPGLRAGFLPGLSAGFLGDPVGADIPSTAVELNFMFPDNLRYANISLGSSRLESIYSPDGYRYVVILLYDEAERRRGEDIIHDIIQYHARDMDSSALKAFLGYFKRKIFLFETPYKKTVNECIGSGSDDQISADDKKNGSAIDSPDWPVDLLSRARSAAAIPKDKQNIRAIDSVAHMAGMPFRASAQSAIRSTCYDFDAARRLMSAAGLAGSGPYLLTFDGSYVGRATVDSVPILIQANGCPRYVHDGQYAEAMAVRFPRDPELDAAIVTALAETLENDDCRTPWLTTVRLEVLDTLVRGSRVTRELAQGIFEMVGVARAAAQGKAPGDEPSALVTGGSSR